MTVTFSLGLAKSGRSDVGVEGLAELGGGGREEEGVAGRATAVLGA